MKFLLPVWGGIHDDLTLAAVELTPEFITWLKERRQVAQRLKEEDAEFWWLVYGDRHPEYYLQEPHRFSEEALGYGLDSARIRLDDDLEIPEGDVRVEFSVINIDEERFFWNVRLKHSTYECETAPISFDDISALTEETL